MSSLTIVVPRHWRAEVADVADTLRAAAAARGDATTRVLGGGRWGKPSTIGRTPDVVLVSDDAPAPARSASGGPPVVRLWWNGADDVRRHLDAHPSSADTHVVFFPDVAASLAGCGADVVDVPYAFAAPTSAPIDGAGLRRTVGCTGEVDISTTCFASLADADPDALGAVAGDLAARVVAGTLTLADAEQEIAGRSPDRAVRHALLWSVRNHVRHRIVAALAERYPSELVLRGDDWRRLGFEALPTSFNRRRRRDGYRRDRVSLDPGSKSTHAALYPRSVEIIAMAGGIAQFDTGDPLPGGAEGLAARRPGTLDAMVDLVGDMLDADPDELMAQNRSLQAGYADLRLAAGGRLLDTLVARAR